jgi:TldD protein
VRRLVVAAVLASAGVARAAARVDDAAVRQAMQDELARSRNELRIGEEPRPYYIAYTITDYDEADSRASFGAPLTSTRQRSRTLRVDMRIGDPAADNGNFAGRFSTAEWYWNPAPQDDDYLALRRELWLRTDDAYRAALERFGAKRAAAERQASSSREQAAGDFVIGKPASVVHPAATRGEPDPAALLATSIKLSALFRDYPAIDDSRAVAVHTVVRRRYLSSEGSWVDDRTARVHVRVMANTQAPDGMRLSNEVAFRAESAAGLPSVAAMEADARIMADELAALRSAPLVDPSDAVVLFEGPAAGQIIKRLLADHLSGTPPPRTASGDDRPDGSLAARIGQRVAPPFLSVFDDPLAERGPGGLALFGSYRADDEGWPAQKVPLVDKGMLSALLMSRTPSTDFARSNGHGRGTPVWAAYQGRIGNLFVSGGPAALPARKLRDKAIAVARESGPRTAIYVVRLLGDNPLVAYRLAHGRAEPVRGLVLQGMNTRSLRDIVAVGDSPYVSNLVDTGEGRGMMGVPSSIVTPALLFKDVEVRRTRDKPPKPPLYPHPFYAAPQ